MTSPRHLSSLYGLTVESPFPLQGALPLAPGPATPDVIVVWKPVSAWREIAVALVEPPAPNGDRPRIGEAADGSLCIEWRSELQFVIAPANDKVAVICRVEKLEFAPTALIGIGMGLLLHRRGVLCLHGSALSISGRTIALLGESGAGKSTAAAALVRGGAVLISDDVVALRQEGGGFVVEGGSTSLRLDEVAKTHLLGEDLKLAAAPWVDKLLWNTSVEKQAVDKHDAPQLRALDAMYFIGRPSDEEGMRIESRLRSMLALRELIEAWYPQGCQRLLTQGRLDDLSAVAQRVPAYILRYPRQWEMLPLLVEIIKR
jgi:hypothetical protein